jgi:hypothetical protein
MTQKTDGSNRKFKEIKLNINLCSEQNYLKNFNRYVKQIFIHELGHYLYYFKDKHTEAFNKLCRTGTRKCESEDFVTTYAMKNKEEDYAESFAHWYMENISHQAMIVDREHGSATTSSLIQETKNQYFSYTYSIL